MAQLELAEQFGSELTIPTPVIVEAWRKGKRSVRIQTPRVTSKTCRRRLSTRLFTARREVGDLILLARAGKAAVGAADAEREE